MLYLNFNQNVFDSTDDDLVYFTTRVSDTSDTSATSVRYERRQCDANATRATQVHYKRHKCNKSATHKIVWLYEWKPGHFCFFKLKVIWLNGLDYSSTSL